MSAARPPAQDPQQQDVAQSRTPTLCQANDDDQDEFDGLYDDLPDSRTTIVSPATDSAMLTTSSSSPSASSGSSSSQEDTPPLQADGDDDGLCQDTDGDGSASDGEGNAGIDRSHIDG